MAHVSPERQREIFEESGFTHAEVDRMEQALRDPALADEDRGQLLYALVNAGRLSGEEVERYAAELGLDAGDVQEGGEAVHENLANARVVLDRVDTWNSVRQAQNSIGQGGYSSSDEIIEQVRPVLEFFKQAHERFQEASGLVNFVPVQPGGEAEESSEFDINAATADDDGPKTASYEYSGMDPQSLRDGLDEFRGINFAVFRSDSEALANVGENVTDGREVLEESWISNTEDWTGSAKDAAKQANENLTQGAEKLSESLATAADGIDAFAGYLESNVQEFAQRLLDLVKDGTLAGLTLPQVDAHIAIVKSLPGQIAEATLNNDVASVLFVEESREYLKRSRGSLEDVCVDYHQKARAFHAIAKEHVVLIDKEYAETIGFLGEQLGADLFAGSAAAGELSGPAATGVPGGGVGGTAGVGSGGSGGVAAPEMPGGGAGSAIPGGAAAAPQELGGDGAQTTNPVTGEELETDPETGEPYPIDPATGEAVKDVDGRQQLTIERGDDTLTMSEPDGEGRMAVTLENANGDLSEYQLDFGEQDAAAQVGDEERSAGEFGPEGSSVSEERTYRPGADGKIRIEDENLTITAERPDGPDGPTLVTVDDSRGDPVSYTLGGEGGEEAVPRAAEQQPPEPEAAPEGGSDSRPAVDAQAQGGAGAGVAQDAPGPAEPTAAEGDPPSSRPSEESQGGPSDGVPSENDAPGSSDDDSGTSTATRPQAFGGDLGGADGVGVETGADSPDRSAPSGVGLGTAPGGDASSGGVSAGPGSGGGTGMMGGMGAMGGGGGGQGGDQERASSAYPIHGDIFDVVTNAVRISGTIGDTGAEAPVRFTR